MRKVVIISRKELAENFITILFKHPAVEKISEGEYMVVPLDKFPDLAHDIGVLLGLVIQEIAVPFEEE